jgi:hypothetical protein
MRRYLGALFGLLLFFGCAVYGPSLLGTADGGMDGGPSDAGDEQAVCNSATYPPRPMADDPDGGDAGDIVLAIRSIRFDVDAGGGNLLGWDLDRVCTCPGKPSCNPGDAQVVCDDPNGRDNSGGLLLQNFMAFAGSAFDAQKLNARINAGDFTMLVRIRDWNGTANDTRVTGELFLSNGMKGSEDGGTPQTPKWDGTDSWTLDPNTLFGGTGPPYIPLPDSVDVAAYVTNGLMVAALNEVSLNLVASSGSGSLKIGITGAVITGHLTPAGGGLWKMDDGLIAGRWATRRFLTSFATIKDPLGTGYLCGDSGTYQSIKKLICNARDISALVQNDNTGAPCDAVSISFGLTAAPALLGNLNPKPPPAQPCGSMWTDECGQ